jgi:hypothetical protein
MSAIRVLSKSPRVKYNVFAGGPGKKCRGIRGKVPIPGQGKNGMKVARIEALSEKK